MSEFHADEVQDYEDVALISEIARERKERASTQPPPRRLPEYVRAIKQSEVTYTLDPMHLPVANMDVGRLMRLVEEAYGLTLAKLDLAPLLAGGGQREFAEISSLTTEQLVSRILRTRNGEVQFEHGRMPTGPHDFVPIIRVVLNGEAVLAAVRGPSHEAELLVQEIAELVWVCSGARRTWAEIEPHVQLKGYGTGTLIDFGSFEDLLHPSLTAFLDRDVVRGKKLGAKASALLATHGFAAPEDSVITWAVDDLYLVLNRFDQRSGAYYKSRLGFSVITRTGYRSGQVLVSSEMPYDAHIEMIEGLVDALKVAPLST